MNITVIDVDELLEVIFALKDKYIEIKHTDTNCESCDKEYKSNMGQRYHMKRSTEATLFNVKSKKF